MTQAKPGTAEHRQHYARFAQLAYENKETLQAPDGWELDRSELTNRNRKLFVNHAERKVIYAFRGTNPRSFNDLAMDAQLAVGLHKYHSRFANAVRFTKKARAAYKDYDMTTTGHSAGGSASHYVSKKTKTPSVTFSAHLPTNEIQQEAIANLFGKRNKRNHVNYSTVVDPVGLGNVLAGNSYIVPMRGSDPHSLKNFL